MAYLLPFTPSATPPPPELPEQKSAKSITTVRKLALVIESYDSLSSYLVKSLNDAGYAVRTAQSGEEGLRLYRDCAPFHVVLIDYCLPRSKGQVLDYCEPQPHGIELAMEIRQLNPSQPMIIAAFAYEHAHEVPRPEELKHVPVLVRVGNAFRQVLDKIDVERAIQELTTTDRLRLKQFAALRMFALGRAARGRTGEDLLSEAILRTLMGLETMEKGRHWNKNVDFVRHLTGAMQSIAHCWKRTFNDNEPYLACELLKCDEEGEEMSPFESLGSGLPTMAQDLIAREREHEILARFKHDPEAIALIQGLLDGLKKSEIVQKYGFSQKRYEAVLKRIRMKLSRRRPDEAGDEHGR